eukprot:jgi/Ulvmu1/8685/UM047_0025.1
MQEKGVGNLSEPVVVQACMFFISAFSFVTMVQVVEPTFSGWTDVFFFCGKSFEFCNCDLSWNALGWYKAIVLWLFTLCFAAGVRNLLAHMLFGGLLPGEEYIDHEAFQTVIVRLIPYWFNQWEQQWGVECTSLLFELPYFAAELLVILPFVQITCRRLKPLLAQHARLPSALQASLIKFGIPITAPIDERGAACASPSHRGHSGGAPHGTPVASAADLLAMDPQHGEWMLDVRQVALWPRLRANAPMIAICACLVAAAVANVAAMTVVINGVVASSDRAQLVHVAARDPGIASGQMRPWEHLVGGGLTAEFAATSEALAHSHSDNGTSPHPDAHFAALAMQASFLYGRAPMRTTECAAYTTTQPRFFKLLPPKRPPAVTITAATRKNSKELAKMRHGRHQRFALALELVLVAMRLSCEGFFVLAATYAAYLLRAPPRLLAAAIRAMSSVSLLLQCALSIFPAVCWVYGAGPIFSTFVSLVFWGAPAWAAYEFVADNLFSVVPQGMRRAGRAVQQRAGPQCVICWGALEEEADAASDGTSESGQGGNGCECLGDCGSGPLRGSGKLAEDGAGGAHDTASVDSAEAQAWGPELVAAEGEPALASDDSRSGGAAPRRRRRRWFPFGRRRGTAAGDDSEDEVVSRPIDTAAEMVDEDAATEACRSREAGGPSGSMHSGSALAERDRQRSMHAQTSTGGGSSMGPMHGGNSAPVVRGVGAPFGAPAEPGAAADARNRHDAPAEQSEEDVDVHGPLHDKAIVVTRCRHVFHYGCLSHWLHQCMVGMRSTACPLCQRQIDVEVRLDALGLLRRLRQQLQQPRAPLGAGGDGEAVPGDHGGDEVVAGMVGAGVPHATFLPIDFLHGHMPPVAELNTGFYQATHQGGDETAVVPIVTRWAHDEALLRRCGYCDRHMADAASGASGGAAMAAHA